MLNFKRKNYFCAIINMAKHNITGKLGEQIARELMERKGYHILETNWYSGKYELDLIACNDQEIVFVEVKTRTSGFLEDPFDAVSDRKIRRTVAAADHYIKKFDIDLEARFDIIGVIVESNGTQVEHIEDAFYPPLW